MQPSTFDEIEFFRAVANSRARALLIGRRALIALGLPVMTSDYDYWIAAEDAALLNAALRPLGLLPTRDPDDARQQGRYVIEGEEHIDVLLAFDHVATLLPRVIGVTCGKQTERSKCCV